MDQKQVQSMVKDAAERKATNLLKFRANTQPAEPARWESISPKVLWETVVRVTADNGAIMLGVTSDGGAYSVCVLHGKDKLKEYAHGKAECETLLGNIADFFTS